jgi:hypothetical protein
MKEPRFARHERLTIVSGIAAIVLTIDVLQLWLLTATMNAYLGHDNTVLLPAGIASLVCLLLNLGLLRYLSSLDR